MGLETTAAAPIVSRTPRPAVPRCMYTTRQNTRSMNREEFQCHNCSGIGHMKRDCPSPRKTTRTPTTNSDGSGSTVLHFKTHSQEISIPIGVYGLKICVVLDTGVRKNVFPLQHCDAIHPDIRPTLQHSAIKTLLSPLQQKMTVALWPPCPWPSMISLAPPFLTWRL